MQPGERMYEYNWLLQVNDRNIFVELVLIFRSGRISSVYIVGWLLLVVGHTFSKLVNFECVGLC